MSKRHLDIENEDLNSVKKIKNDDKSEDDEEEEEEKEPLPIAAVIENNDGTIHPTNKQYFVYKNTQPSMVSNTARFWSRKYLKILRHVNPDVYNVCRENCLENNKSFFFVFCISRFIFIMILFPMVN